MFRSWRHWIIISSARIIFFFLDCCFNSSCSHVWHLARAKVIYQEYIVWRNPDQKCCAVWCRDWAMTANQRPGEILTDQWGARDDVTQIGDVGVAEEAQAANWEHLTPGDTDQWGARTVSQWPMRGQGCAEDDAARVRGSLAALLTPNIQTGCTNIVNSDSNALKD